MVLWFNNKNKQSPTKNNKNKENGEEISLKPSFPEEKHNENDDGLKIIKTLLNKLGILFIF